MARARARAESRARYYVRKESDRRGWRTAHVSAGGHFLEENEISAFFEDIGLGQDRPDFLVCFSGAPSMVIEAKNEAGKSEVAIQEAMDYADCINESGKYSVKIAVGAAGEEDQGYAITVRYKSDAGWVPLCFKGQEITTVPSPLEVELALEADNGTTTVSIPDSAAFVDAAIELSGILRAAKIEAPLRPKVIGAVVLAMYQGKIDINPERALDAVNQLVRDAITAARDIVCEKKKRLIDAITLTQADFHRLSNSMGRVENILRRLNVRSVLQTDTDFLGMFYEAFLRYGYDNNALGIVFTPRHITRSCVNLIGASPTDKVIDIASGTGGFLVAAFDKMLGAAKSQASIDQVKSALYGFDTNPTVWAMASLNMLFRGDGKSHIELGSCLEDANRATVKRSFSRAFLNPPFSQKTEPEVAFIDAAMDALQAEGLLVAVVYAGVFADDDHKDWRAEFLRNHTLLGMISLPNDLFYPTAADTSILIAQAHVPHSVEQKVFMGRIWNDGYTKLKNRRVECTGGQINEIEKLFHNFRAGRIVGSPLVTLIAGHDIRGGIEWSPQQWLPQPAPTEAELKSEQTAVLRSIYQAAAYFPGLAEEALDAFCETWKDLPALPHGKTAQVSDFFDVATGASTGEKNYSDGSMPYISSGDSTNSIVRLVSPVFDEYFPGGLTVTAFGFASVQPWRFMARGNGGSAVRVLTPRYAMSPSDLVWFAAQINIQRWRFFYARMAIKSRLERLTVTSPMPGLGVRNQALAANIRAFALALNDYSATD